MSFILTQQKNIDMKTAVMSTFAVLILLTLWNPTVMDDSSATSAQSMEQRSKEAAGTQLSKSQKLSSLQARIHVISQQITTLQAQIAAMEAAHNVRVNQLQKILASPQSGQKASATKGAALPEHGVGFRQTPLGATLSVNGANITLTPARLSIKGVRQIVLQANSIHLKSPLVQFNEGNRPLAGAGDIVTGVLAYTPMGIPIPNLYLHGLIVTGSTSVLVP